MQTRRHRAGPVHRHRPPRPGRTPARPALHRHRAVLRVRPARGRATGPGRAARTGAGMTSYRRMRRQSRQARRAGMQPMMVIGSGDGFPELAVVVIARWAWRYRSELAPLGVALIVAGFRLYAPAALSAWPPPLLPVPGLAT